MNLYEFAEKVGRSRGTIALWEKQGEWERVNLPRPQRVGRSRIFSKAHLDGAEQIILLKHARGLGGARSRIRRPPQRLKGQREGWTLFPRSIYQVLLRGIESA